MRTFAILAVLWTVPAWAQGGSKQEARALFKQGNELLRRGDYVGALSAFRDAYDHWQNPKILLNMGTALRQLGRNAEAADAYERYLAEAPRGKNAKRSDREKRAEVEALLAELEKKVGRFRISANVDGARLLVDGRHVGDSPLPHPVRVEPGSHSVAADKEGMAPAFLTVSVATGEERGVELLLKESGAVAAPAQTAGGEQAEPATEDGPATVDEPAAQTTARKTKTVEPTSSWKRTAGWWSLGIGGVLASAGILFGGIAADRADTVEKNARDSEPFDPTVYEQGKNAEKAQVFGLVVGGAALVTGTVLLLLADDGSPPAVSASGHSLMVRF